MDSQVPWLFNSHVKPVWDKAGMLNARYGQNGRPRDQREIYRSEMSSCPRRLHEKYTDWVYPLFAD